MSIANSMTSLSTVGECTLHFCGDAYTVKGDAAMNYSEFSLWAKERLGVETGERLEYFDEHGKEVIPCGGFLGKHPNVFAKKVGNKLSGGSSGTTKPLFAPGSYMNEAWKVFATFGWSVLVLLLAITVAPETDSKKSYSELFDLLLELTDAKAWKDILLEGYIAFITWATAYLFIRRCLNPENSDSLRKYGPDAWFGGMAAAAATIMKKLLLKLLDVKRS